MIGLPLEEEYASVPHSNTHATSTWNVFLLMYIEVEA
jgi:hypothetical protein